MSSKSHSKILTELVNLEGVKVTNYIQHEGVGVILHLASERDEAICPQCGNLSHNIHQNHRYLVKDLPLIGQPVYLEINRRQFKCKICNKPFSEQLDFVKTRRKYTNRLANNIVGQVLENDIKSVAERNNVTPEEIETMLKDAFRQLNHQKPIGLKRLGIDEIALIKGQGKYCAVLVDLDQGKLIEMISDRRKEKIAEILTGWGTEVLLQIEEVSIDLWITYKNLVEELMPNVQVVADRFHVMKQVNTELDNQMKKEKREAEKINYESDKEQMLSGLNKSKYALLKNEDNLTEEQKDKLEEVKQVSPTLSKMHQLKEELRMIFKKPIDWLTALFELSNWLLSSRQYYPESQNTMLRWFDEIIAYFDHRTTNGMVEGINNKLKLIKRSAFGFSNFDNFKIRSLLNWHFNY
ncbi:ISL3 family transposase [Nostoc sp.]|uniref:ISL3 family transposase n=1 Tax=Nostoc sp. TaxID=1180 RepID=UPI002FF7CB33